MIGGGASGERIPSNPNPNPIPIRIRPRAVDHWITGAGRAYLAVEEGLLQQRQQLLAVHVAGVQPQRLARELVRLLEVALTEHTHTAHTTRSHATCMHVRMYVCMNTILYAISAEL